MYRMEIDVIDRVHQGLVFQVRRGVLTVALEGVVVSAGGGKCPTSAIITLFPRLATYFLFFSSTCLNPHLQGRKCSKTSLTETPLFLRHLRQQNHPDNMKQHASAFSKKR